MTSLSVEGSRRNLREKMEGSASFLKNRDLRKRLLSLDQVLFDSQSQVRTGLKKVKQITRVRPRDRKEAGPSGVLPMP